MIPIVIVSGYLGAGKTTLIRDFLHDPGPRRACVMVNDFGKVNLDAALIKETGADTVALTNGCACCTIGDDLIGSVQQVIDGPADFDLIIVEASGVSQPARIAMLLAGVAGAEKARCLTVVNMQKARELSRDKFVGRLFHQQIDQADALTLNRQTVGRDMAGLLPEEYQECRTLHQFVEAGADGHTKSGALLDTDAIKPGFHQEFQKLSVMHRADFQNWCKSLPETIHRAKGYVMLTDDNRNTPTPYMADIVQGELSLNAVSKLPHDFECGLVLISIKQ